MLQAPEGSLLCRQAPVTPRLYSLLLCYVSYMCAEIGKKMVLGVFEKKNLSLATLALAKNKEFQQNYLKNKQNY